MHLRYQVVREEEFLRLGELLVPSVVRSEEETSRACQSIVILRRSDNLVYGTGDLVLGYLSQSSIFDLDHGQLATLLPANYVVQVHRADGENVSAEGNVAQDLEVLRNVHNEELSC